MIGNLRLHHASVPVPALPPAATVTAFSCFLARSCHRILPRSRYLLPMWLFNCRRESPYGKRETPVSIKFCCADLLPLQIVFQSFGTELHIISQRQSGQVQYQRPAAKALPDVDPAEDLSLQGGLFLPVRTLTDIFQKLLVRVRAVAFTPLRVPHRAGAQVFLQPDFVRLEFCCPFLPEQPGMLPEQILQRVASSRFQMLSCRSSDSCGSPPRRLLAKSNGLCRSAAFTAARLCRSCTGFPCSALREPQEIHDIKIKRQTYFAYARLCFRKRKKRIQVLYPLPFPSERCKRSAAVRLSYIWHFLSGQPRNTGGKPLVGLLTDVFRR